MPEAPRGTGWEMFSPPQVANALGVPERRYEERFPFLYHGMGMGREGGKPLG